MPQSLHFVMLLLAALTLLSGFEAEAQCNQIDFSDAAACAMALSDDYGSCPQECSNLINVRAGYPLSWD